ncbi:MAG: hypothetical protein AB8B69_18905 [Chitinophagales bacterium]
MPKAILYITYANDSKNHLKWLTYEYEKVHQLLEVGDRKQHYTLRMDSFVNREKLHSDLVKYRQDLQVFSFSGHAGRDVLLLEDGQANADGIALALQQCAQLKLVVLNAVLQKGKYSNYWTWEFLWSLLQAQQLRTIKPPFFPFASFRH